MFRFRRDGLRSLGFYILNFSDESVDFVLSYENACPARDFHTDIREMK
jgi:hypothetical protein